MATNGLENMTPQELSFELQQGARFIVYQYCISMVFLTLKRPSKVVIVRPGESRVTKSLRFTLLSAVLGWWGIPWGIIRTPQAIALNLKSKRTNHLQDHNNYLRSFTLSVIGELETYKGNKEKLQQILMRQNRL